MKTKFKFGSKKNNISEFLTDISGYFKNLRKIVKKFINLNKFREKDILPANGHDICNYLARYGIANFQIQTIMKLDGRLDFEKLSRAVRLSVDAEPVLGCHFVECDVPYWKHIDDIDKIVFCEFEETDCPDEAVQRFLESPLDMDYDPMVKVKLIRSGSCDTLGVKLNHTCCDGAGTKEYLYLLSEIYSGISRKDGSYVLEPSIRSNKDQRRIFKTFGNNYPFELWNPFLKIPIPMWKFPWRAGKRDAVKIAMCRLSNDQFDEIYKYGKLKGATINDLILTAFYRAMFEMSKAPFGIPMEIQLTVDLRRYLPNHKAEAIRNLSGGVDTSIARKVHETFEETLIRVMYIMNKIKRGYPGLQNAIAAEFVEKQNFNTTCGYYQFISRFTESMDLYPYNIWDKCAPVLSNLGLISKPLLKFDNNVVTDAYIVPPAVRKPGLLLIAGTYNGILTLSVCYYKDTIRKNYVEELIVKIMRELIEGCK